MYLIQQIHLRMLSAISSRLIGYCNLYNELSFYNSFNGHYNNYNKPNALVDPQCNRTM